MQFVNRAAVHDGTPAPPALLYYVSQQHVIAER